MRVDGNQSIGPTGGRRAQRVGAGGSASFADALAEEPASAAAKAAPVGGLGSLFALQEIPDATAQRRKALARAGRILDRLAELQQGLLAGTVDRTGLNDLAASARSARAAAGDPGLDDLLGEVELRAAVELAKLSKVL
ncbi:MAG: flagellar assembly protein FliX [Alphaproteobacteria bacterium]|nr:flagellar assembly protein FliX [Alphaproteobacteria bacterium]